MPEDFALYAEWPAHPNREHPKPTETLEKRAQVQPSGKETFDMEGVPLGVLWLRSNGPFKVRTEMRSAPSASWKPAPVLRKMALPEWTPSPLTKVERRLSSDQLRDADLIDLRHGQTTVPVTEASEGENVASYGRAFAVEPAPRFLRILVLEGEAPVRLSLQGGVVPDYNAPAPRPDTTAASSAERNGFFPFASAAPSSVGAKAIRQAKHGWPEEDHDGRPKYPFTQKRPHHVTGHFMIVVPDSDQAGPAVEAEVAQRVLNEFGRHTTRLHLACAAYSVKGDPSKYTPIPRQYVYDMLGMKWDQRSDLSRDEKDREVEKAIRNLRKLGVQITVLDGPEGAPAELGLESVWGINVVRWGQKRAVGADRLLDTEHWQLMVRPNAWQQLYLNEESGVRQFGYFSRKLIENIDWGNKPAAGDLAIELLKYVRFQDGGQPRDLRVETMLEICGLNQAEKSWEQTRNRQKLERAILEQERWGWDVEWTRWPDAYRPDKESRPDFPRKWWQGNERDNWEDSFHEWKVTFYPPEDLAEMNSRAQEIDNSDPHELEPKGWPDRIEAIINETDYTQADLSRILEVSRAAVSQWKNGNRTPKGPHRAKLEDIERWNGLRKS